MTAQEHDAEALTLRLREIIGARAAERRRADERDAEFQRARDETMRALYATKVKGRLAILAHITGLTQGGVTAIVVPRGRRRTRATS